MTMPALTIAQDHRPPSTTRPVQPAAAAFTAVRHDSLDGVAATWLYLQSRGTCTAYQRLEWVTGIVDRIMPEQKARVLIVEVVDRQTGECVLLLPLALIRRPLHTVITWLDLGVCDYAAPLVAPGFVATPRTAQDIWTAVLAVLPRVDLIKIDRIPERLGNSANPLALLPLAEPIPLQAYGLPIEGPPATLLKRLCGSSVDQRYRRSNRRMAERGEVRFVMAADEAEAASLFETLLEQRRQRFRDIGRFDLLDFPHVREFYREAVKTGLRSGPARLFGISVGGQYIATALGLVHGGTFHGILLAMDHEWRKVGPGLQIALEIMLWARREGLGYFDFTIGDLPYKADLGARPNTLLQLAQPQSARGWLALAGMQSMVRGKSWLQSHPQAFERLRKLRGALRRLAKRGDLRG